MKIKIKFNTENSAFDIDTVSEVAQMLRDIAIEIEHASRTSGTCLDVNGNTIGRWSWK